LPQQSPINLLSPVSKYGIQYVIQSGDKDAPSTDYKDMDKTEVKFNPLFYSFEIKVDHSKGYSGFKSKLGETLFDSKYQWDGYEILFHSPSEHTIDGRRYDLEMQIIHNPFLTQEEIEAKNAASALSGGARRLQSNGKEQEKKKENTFAIVSMLFDVNDYRPVNETTKANWNKFWTQLDIEHRFSEHLDFGKVMKFVNFRERWVYRGSLTVPPCTQYVYWNVINDVFPVDAESV
jgi:carbonic anhydrase